MPAEGINVSLSARATKGEGATWYAYWRPGAPHSPQNRKVGAAWLVPVGSPKRRRAAGPTAKGNWPSVEVAPPLEH